jgi:hypothetical protein
MTRQIVAHHDPLAVTSPHIGAALAVHRAAAALSLVELLTRAAQPGPARRALEHAHDCVHCGVGHLCPVGLALASKLKPNPTRTRAWLALRSAAVAEARAQKQREGAA